MKFGSRTFVAVLATTFLAVGVSSIAWAADQNTTPGAVIALSPSPTPSSGIDWGVAVDANDNVYVSRVADDIIEVYAPGNIGTAAPIRVIHTEPGPTLIHIFDGKLYVPTYQRVSVYDLTGTLLFTITGGSTGISSPYDVGTDAAGNIYVPNSRSSEINVFAANASGDVAPIRTISGAQTGLQDPMGINVAADGSFWIADHNGTHMARFAAGASGNVSPIQTISGAATHVDNAVDSITGASGELLVSDFSYGFEPGAVSYFPATVNGNVAPTNRIIGNDTQLTRALGLAQDSCGGLFVANYYAKVAVFGTPCGGSGSVTGGGTVSGGSASSGSLAQTGQPVSPLWFVGGASVLLGGVLAFFVFRRRTR